jgi:hypothetical protein
MTDGKNPAMEKISAFYKRLGFPLKNIRWSWGARSSSGVLLTTWTDELDGRFARVSGWEPNDIGKSLAGLHERIDQLRMLWAGGLAGYAVLAKAKDINAHPRTIDSFETEYVRTIVTLKADADGSIWAQLGAKIPIERLHKHASRHRLIPAFEVFPVLRELERKSSRVDVAPYMQKLPEMRRWLIDLARKQRTATYSEARKPFDLQTFEHSHAMERIGHECLEAGEPILTALIVDKSTARCSKGFFEAFGRDDEEERADCFEFWSDTAPARSKPVAGSANELPFGPQLREVGVSLRERAANFAKVAVRPDQAAFRRRVFLGHEGKCAVTGCSIPEALDAAHRSGRDWKLGNNRAVDGLLLRKDIHALYDAKLISINDDGRVVFAPEVADHYRAFATVHRG